MHIVYCVMYNPHYVMCDEQPMFCMVCDIQPTLYIVWWTTCILYCVVQPHCIPFYVHKRHCIQCDDQPLCILCCVHPTMLYDPHCIGVMYNSYMPYSVQPTRSGIPCFVQPASVTLLRRIHCVLCYVQHTWLWCMAHIMCSVLYITLYAVQRTVFSVQSATLLYAVLFFYEELVWN